MEWYTTENGKYRIESLTPATFPGALEVIRESFCQDEAVSIGSEINKNPKAAEELLELCADAALDGVSLVTVNATGNGKTGDRYTIIMLYARADGYYGRVIRESFCQDEAVSIGSEINKNPKAAEELLELCADAALDGVSLVAVDTTNGEVVAASFNKLQVATSDASEKPFFEIFAEERCTQPSSRSLVLFMATVDAKCNLFQKLNVDCSLEIMFLATLKEHRKQRLGEFLTKFSVDLAKKLKNGPVSKFTTKDLGPYYSYMQPKSPTTKYPKICQAIWTAEPTQKIGRKLNFTVHLSVSFEEFVYEGKTYAERIGTENPFCEIAAIVL